MGGCGYTLDPDEATTLEERWDCPHETYRGSDRCVFHLGDEERESAGVDDDTRQQAFREVCSREGRRSKELIGAELGDLDLSYAILDAPDKYPVDLRHASVGRIDLSNGEVHQPIDLRHATVGSLEWTDAEFTAEVRMEAVACEGSIRAEGLVVADDFDARGAVFEAEVTLDEARFHGDTCLKETRFHGTAWFRGAEFRGDANLLDDDACFEDGVFESEVAFTKAEFRYADFVNVTFREGVEFEEATFDGDAEFRGAEFEGRAGFRGAEFHGDANVRIDDADFRDARFADEATFEGARYRKAVFSGATFDGPVEFSDCVFDGEASFTGATFGGSIGLDEARFHDDASFADVTFADGLSLRGAEFHGGDNVEDEDLTFAGATVDGPLDAAHAEFSFVTFAGVTFRGETNFAGAAFDGEAVFENGEFDADATFDEARFDDDAAFGDVAIAAGISLRGAEFHGGDNVEDEDLTFAGATVDGPFDAAHAEFSFVTFEGARFGDHAEFGHAEFAERIDFSGATFEAEAGFAETRFRNDTSFRSCQFEAGARFPGAEFSGGDYVENDDVTFAGATFEGPVDFRSARFQYADFSGVAVHGRADFSEARFSLDAVFRGVQLSDEAKFLEVRFREDVDFEGAEFEGAAAFRGAEFQGGANTEEDDLTFEGATFSSEADFHRAQFRYATFGAVDFLGNVRFAESKFADDARFVDCTFVEAADFDEVRFTDDAAFEGATFEGHARFRGVEFHGGANLLDDDVAFGGVEFRGDVTFEQAEFAYTDFSNATFEGDAVFAGASFTDEATFDGVRIGGDADFDRATFGDSATFRGAEFDGESMFDQCRFEDNAGFREATFGEPVEFTGTLFEGSPTVLSDDADFRRARFESGADFEQAEFRYANFEDAAFEGEAAFDWTVFENGADYGGSRVTGAFRMCHARIEGDSSFEAVVFEDAATFEGTKFLGGSNMESKDVVFDDAAFHGETTFERAEFNTASFQATRFGLDPSFEGAVFNDAMAFQIAPVDDVVRVNMQGAELNDGYIAQPVEGATFYDLTGATVREVKFEPNDSDLELLDYFLFVETDFDGFDFSEHMDLLSRNNWTIHGFGHPEFADGGDDLLTPSRLERTYLMAKNSANAFGHRKAASEFYIKEFTYRRKKNLDLLRDQTADVKTRLKAGGKWFGNWLLYETCGYGERLWRIVYISALVIVAWAVLYATVTEGTRGPGDLMTSGFESVGQALSPEGVVVLGRTLYFSIVTFTTLGYGDVQPIGPVARTLAGLESFLGALLVALVVFVIGRRMA